MKWTHQCTCYNIRVLCTVLLWARVYRDNALPVGSRCEVWNSESWKSFVCTGG
jgi:hypothetical protein